MHGQNHTKFLCVLSASEFPTTITKRQLLLAGLE